MRSRLPGSAGQTAKTFIENNSKKPRTMFLELSRTNGHKPFILTPRQARRSLSMEGTCSVSGASPGAAKGTDPEPVVAPTSKTVRDFDKRLEPEPRNAGEVP